MANSAAPAKPLPRISANTAAAEDYAQARRENWVAQSSRGLEVLRYRQGWAVLRHPQLEKGPAFRRRLDDIGLTSGPAREAWEEMLICNEGEVRDRLRKPLMELFSPVQMAKLQAHVRAIVDEVLDEIEDPADVDLMEQIAWLIPSRVYCHLISAPKSLAPRMALLSDSILAPILTCDKARLQDSIDAVAAAWSFIEEHIEARRRDLGDDFTSLMIRQQMAGLLTQRELIMQAMSIQQASIDNTVHQIGLTMGALLEDQDRWRRLADDPGLVGKALEETFRMRPRFGTIFRYAREAVELEDIVIPADSWVFVSTRSAGRDEEAFEDPDSFRLDRPATRPLMFGAGPYNCLGQTLARLEITELLKALLERFPGIRLLGDWRVRDTNAVSEVSRLRVALA